MNVESINISSYSSNETLTHINTLHNLELLEVKIVISSTGEAHPYITGIGYDINNEKFKAICFLDNNSEHNLRKFIKSNLSFPKNIKFTKVLPSDYIKSIGVTFNNCVLEI